MDGAAARLLVTKQDMEPQRWPKFLAETLLAQEQADIFLVWRRGM
jgi:hypothetical protein